MIDELKVSADRMNYGNYRSCVLAMRPESSRSLQLHRSKTDDFHILRLHQHPFSLLSSFLSFLVISQLLLVHTLVELAHTNLFRNIGSPSFLAVDFAGLSTCAPELPSCPLLISLRFYVPRELHTSPLEESETQVGNFRPILRFVRFREVGQFARSVHGGNWVASVETNSCFW